VAFFERLFLLENATDKTDMIKPINVVRIKTNVMCCGSDSIQKYFVQSKE